MNSRKYAAVSSIFIVEDRDFLIVARFSSLPVGIRLTIDTEKRVAAALLVLIVSELALIFVTWPLWWPNGSFPVIPLLPVELPGQHFALMAFLLLLVVIARRLWACVRCSFGNLPLPDDHLQVAAKSEESGPSISSHRLVDVRSSLLRAQIGALFFGLVLFLGSQHRLQPWHWLLLLNLACGLLRNPDRRLAAMRNVAATVYVCAALSRITLAPEQSIAAVIVQQLLNQLNLQWLETRLGGPGVLCHLASTTELLTGILLLIPRTRLPGCAMSILLHSGLLLALGPVGLNHHAGVLIWNLCFLVLIPVLFAGNDRSSMRLRGDRSAPPVMIVLLVWLFPVSGLFGIADNWPSWQLYSSRPETWTLFVHEDDVSLLPSELQGFLGKPAAMMQWIPVKLDRWSLQTTASPIYPEGRFQAAIIEHVLQRCRRPVRFQIEVSSPRRLQWWLREASVISSMEELDAAHQRN